MRYNRLKVNSILLLGLDLKEKVRLILIPTVNYHNQIQCDETTRHGD